MTPIQDVSKYTAVTRNAMRLINHPFTTSSGAWESRRATKAGRVGARAAGITEFERCQVNINTQIEYHLRLRQAKHDCGRGKFTPKKILCEYHFFKRLRMISRSVSLVVTRTWHLIT